MKKSLLLGGFLASTPLALLLPGCSGGSFGGLGGLVPGATATPAATATPIPAALNL